MSYRFRPFLSRQTDLIVAAANTNRVINVKKGQFLAPEDVQLSSLRRSNHRVTISILLTERGTSFGYHNLVVDMRSFPILARNGISRGLRHHPQCAATWRGQWSASAGQAQFIHTLASAGVAAGVDSVFLEVHEKPDSSPRATVPTPSILSSLEPLLRHLVELDRADPAPASKHSACRLT